MYRPKHKRSNWFVAVIAISGVRSEEIIVGQLKKEIVFETFKSSGPGGQHVNKANSAVRLIHKPTGIRLRVDTNRSQHRNRVIAVERLELLLREATNKYQQTMNRERWLTNYQIQRGDPKKIFFGYDFQEK